MSKHVNDDLCGVGLFVHFVLLSLGGAFSLAN